jgi:hypothetical protein
VVVTTLHDVAAAFVIATFAWIIKTRFFLVGCMAKFTYNLAII